MRKWLYGKTRREVSDKIDEAKHARKQGLPIVSDRETVGQYLERWLAGAESSVRGLTFRRYAQLVRVHLIPLLGPISLKRLTPADCGKAYAAMAAHRAPRTVGHAHRVLRRALREAEAAGLVAKNVVRLARPPRVPHAEMRTLTREQAKGLLLAFQCHSTSTP